MGALGVPHLNLQVTSEEKIKVDIFCNCSNMKI